jgi:hypothetical protein
VFGFWKRRHWHETAHISRQEDGSFHNTANEKRHSVVFLLSHILAQRTYTQAAYARFGGIEWVREKLHIGHEKFTDIGLLLLGRKGDGGGLGLGSELAKRHFADCGFQ